MEFITKLVIILSLLYNSQSYSSIFSSVNKQLKQYSQYGHRQINTHLLATELNFNDLTVDDIAARWKVVKFGQGLTANNGIELLDRLLAVKTVKIPMSRVGGLGVLDMCI